jgi:hypothetical protein
MGMNRNREKGIDPFQPFFTPISIFSHGYTAPDQIRLNPTPQLFPHASGSPGSLHSNVVRGQ